MVVEVSVGDWGVAALFYLSPLKCPWVRYWIPYCSQQNVATLFIMFMVRWPDVLPDSHNVCQTTSVTCPSSGISKCVYPSGGNLLTFYLYFHFCQGWLSTGIGLSGFVFSNSKCLMMKQFKKSSWICNASVNLLPYWRSSLSLLLLYCVYSL